MSSSEGNREDQRETGSAMMAIGWVLVLFALLVFFFSARSSEAGRNTLRRDRRVPRDRGIDSRGSGHVDEKKK